MKSAAYKPPHGGRKKENRRYIFWLHPMKKSPPTPEQQQRIDRWRKVKHPKPKPKLP